MIELQKGHSHNACLFRVLCRTVLSSSDGQSAVRSGPVTITLPGRVGHSSRQKFYFLNATLHDMTPRQGPRSGGTRVTFTGVHLDIGSNVTVVVGGQPCRLERDLCSSTRLICITSVPRIVSAASASAEVIVQIDGATRRLPADFIFSADPIITDIEPLTAFLSGGTSLRVYGDNFESISQVRMLITWPRSPVSDDSSSSTLDEMMIVNQTDCQVQTGRFVVCPAPAVPTTLNNVNRRVDAALQEGTDPAANYVFDVVIEMDGWRSSEGPRRQIAYYSDPVVRPFAEGEHFHQVQGEPLVIQVYFPLSSKAKQSTN